MVSHRQAWIRWLSARGLPPGHIARVLGCDPARVAEALRTRHGRQRWDLDASATAEARRMRAEGATFRAIGRALGVAYQHVRWALGRAKWKPRVPDRPPGSGNLRGPVGAWCRRLAGLGYDPSRIAELLGCDPSRVAELLAGPRPVRVTWSSLRGQEWRDEPAPPPPAAAELAAVEVLALAPATSPVIAPAATPCGVWGPMQDSWASGEMQGNAALTDAEAAAARELRARGVPRKEVAARFGVSVATITRITRGETYRDAQPEPDQVAPEPPAIAGPTGPAPATWKEPKRPGRAHRDD